MNASLLDSLRYAEARFSADLFTPHALSNLYDLAAKLPSSRGAVLECRLEDQEPRVDLSICLPTDFTIDKLDKSTLLQLQLCKYQKIFDSFSCSRSNTFSQLIPNIYSSIEDIWLEFDVIGGASNIPMPAIGLHLNQIGDLSNSIFGQKQTLLTHKELVNRLVEDLLEQDYPTILKTNIQKCIELLPAEATIIFLGVASSRQANAVRFIINKIPPIQISTYLLNVGWAGDINDLQTQIIGLSDLVDNIVLSFNIAHIISPQIGLECYLVVKEWQHFLNYLVMNGMCTPAKSKALLGWTGIAEEASHYINNIEQKTHVYKKFENLIRFGLSVKVTIDSSKPLSAKGYLGLWNDII